MSDEKEIRAVQLAPKTKSSEEARKQLNRLQELSERGVHTLYGNRAEEER